MKKKNRNQLKKENRNQRTKLKKKIQRMKNTPKISENSNYLSKTWSEEMGLKVKDGKVVEKEYRYRNEVTTLIKKDVKMCGREILSCCQGEFPKSV